MCRKGLVTEWTVAIQHHPTVTVSVGRLGALTCLWLSAACTEGLFSICWASRRLRALAKCCCCMVARMLTAVGCLFFSMLVKLRR